MGVDKRCELKNKRLPTNFVQIIRDYMFYRLDNTLHHVFLLTNKEKIATFLLLLL